MPKAHKIIREREFLDRIPLSMFQLTSSYVLHSLNTSQNIAKILKKDKEGKDIIKELKKGLLSYSNRCKMVRILVSWLIKIHQVVRTFCNYVHW